MVTGVLFGAFIILLILQVPIGIALGAASLVTIWYSGLIKTTLLAQSLTTAVDSFPIMAIPFFILAGSLMGAGGISQRLLNVAGIMVGRMTGGLSLVTIAACMLFSSICGSGPATVAAIGGLMFPAMVKAGYDKGFAGGLVSMSGSLGVIFPPSIPMVVYCIAAERVSIADLFLAGVFPGFLVGACLMTYAWYVSRQRGWKEEHKPLTVKEVFAVLNDAKWALFAPVIILGGIYGGVFTPTEAAAVAVMYGFIVGLFIYKALKWRDMPRVVINAGLMTATILVIFGTAITFARIMTMERVPQQLVEIITTFSTNPLVILLMINILLLFVGLFMETLALIIILAPILLPVITAVGIDPVHFGMIMIVNLAIGFSTPPVGINLFVTSAISKMPLEELVKAVTPWFFVMLVALAGITYFPAMSTWLPALVRG